jgi:sugar lactone lactonase YvrE
MNFIRRPGADERTKREDITMRHFRLVICAGILLILSGAASAQQDYINVYAGGGPNNVAATTAPVYTPTNVTVDSSGNVYFSSEGSNYQHRVWKITKSTGILTIVAGTYYYGYSGDGGQATNAQLYDPRGIAVDHSGNVFIADYNNCLIREVNAGTGIITTIAGITTPNLSCGSAGDGGPATSAHLYTPTGVAIDKNGNLFIADQNNHKIRMISCATVTSTGGACTANAGQTTGDIYTVAGTGTAGYNGDGITAITADLYYPYGVATDTDGNLYIADQYNHRIRRVACGTGISGCVNPSGETGGDIYTLAGTGTAGFSGEGGAATSAELYYPTTISVANSGDLFISDYDNFRIREVSCATTTSTGGACTTSSGQTAADIYTVVGTGVAGFSGGDGVAATSSTLYYAIGVAVDSSGDLFIADQDNERIREVPCDVSTLTCTPPAGDTAKFIYTIAGTGGTTFFGNGIPATGAELYYPTGVASDSSGNIYIADRSNCVIREVNAGTGIITTFAGNGACGYGGDGGAATSANLSSPTRVAVDSSNNVYIADTNNCLIRKVSGGTITTFAGKSPSLACGYTGDGGAATGAELYYPDGVAVDSSGNVYIADQYNYVVRKVSGGSISTFAGNHTYGYAGDGGPAASAELSYVLDVAVDGFGNVYIADQYNHRIRKVSTSGTISTYAGNGTAGYEGDGGLAYQTSLYYPTGVAIDGAGDVIISDYDNQRVRMVDESNIIHTIAGNGTAGFNGNDILATLAELYQPWGVAVDPSGNVYEVDYQNWLVRKVNALTILNSYPSSVSFGTVTKGTTSDPVVVTLSANGTVNIASITPSAQFKETDDCPTTLNSGQTCVVDVQFAPTAPGTVNGTLTVSYAGFFSPSLIVPLQGSGTSLTLSPTSLAFGNQSLNNSVTKTITVKGATTYAATPVTFTGDTTDFTLASNTCTGAVTTSCVIGVAFDPKSSGAKKATLVIHDNDPTNPQLAALTGTGTSFESFTPATITFKPTLVNANSTNTKVTFKYTGTGSITLNSLVASANFSINYTGLTSGNCSAQPLTLITNQTCTFNVAFNPGTTLGTIPGTVTANFTADANGSTSLQMPVTGTGTEVKITGTLAFGTTSSPLTKSVTITNEGTLTLTFSPAPTISGTGAAEYTIDPYSGSTSTCLNPSAMLTHLQTCTIAVTFNPPVGSGTSYPADLNINDNGGGSPQVVAITGKN